MLKVGRKAGGAFGRRRRKEAVMIQSLARGMEILSYLERCGSATINEIADELGVDKSTASRLVDTMKHYDMVRLDPMNKKYRLGLRILYLGDGVRRSINVASISRPFMHKLCEAIGESVHLASVSNDMVYIIDQVRSKRKYNLSANIGMIEPWHCSSVGKCILAYMPDDEVERICSGQEMTRYTKKTITKVDKLKKELARIREAGYAMDDEEVVEGVCCIATPIFNYGGYVNHSLGISGPAAHLTAATLTTYIEEMRRHSKRISGELGHGIIGKQP